MDGTSSIGRATSATIRHLFLSVIVVAAFVANTTNAAPGDIYVGDAGGTISRFSPSGTKRIFVSNLKQPIGLAFDASGNLFAADSLSNSIVKITPAGIASIFAAGVNFPTGVAFDGSGNLYVSEGGFPGRVLKFTPAGVKSTFAGGLDVTKGLAFDRSGNLFVLTQGGDNDSGRVLKFTPGGTKTTFGSGLQNPAGLAFDASGNLFVSDYNGDRIVEFTPAGIESTFASGIAGPEGLAFDQSGNLFVANTSSGTILKFTPAGTKSTFASGLNSPFGLAFEPVLEKLRNISTRGLVGTGDGALIAGFILGGNAVATNSILVRALGPSLTGSGVPGALQDPTLEVFNSSGVLIATNDNWKASQPAQIQATGIALSNDREAAILMRLPAGNHTVVVRGINNGTGVALVEVYTLR